MNMSASPTVWLHVSTLMNWNRPPVGIVRVEREYCRWLLARSQAGAGERVRFCVYDRVRKQFTEVDVSQVAARVGFRLSAEPSPAVVVDFAPPVPAPEPAPRELAAWKRRVKQVWNATKPYLPESWAAVIGVKARLAYHHLLQARRRFEAAQLSLPANQPLIATEPEVPPAAFERGDRWVSLGADWEYLDQQALYRVKQRLDLTVTLICYDAIPVLFPQFFVGVLSPGGFGAYLVDLAWCADAVLCISDCTRRDFEAVINRLGGPLPPTHVIRLGSEIHKTDTQSVEPPEGLATGPQERPFVLFVSTIERRKNHEVLYRAWARLRDQGVVPHRLVFVGMRGWGVDELFNDLKLDPRIKDDIVSLNHVTDAQLAWLYQNAAFTVFPSLYEGWGLPVVESLAWGKFCLVSNAASLPEAGGPWTEYLDPWDLPAWVERLGYYMQQPQALAVLNERIAREFRAPGWADTAATIHAVATRAVPQRGPA